MIILLAGVIYHFLAGPNEITVADHEILELTPFFTDDHKTVCGLRASFFGIEFALLLVNLRPGVQTSFDDALYRPAGYRVEGSNARIEFAWRDGPKGDEILLRHGSDSIDDKAPMTMISKSYSDSNFGANPSTRQSGTGSRAERGREPKVASGTGSRTAQAERAQDRKVGIGSFYGSAERAQAPGSGMRSGIGKWNGLGHRKSKAVPHPLENLTLLKAATVVRRGLKGWRLSLPQIRNLHRLCMFLDMICAAARSSKAVAQATGCMQPTMKGG